VKSIEQRFWAKVAKSETCWLWIGATHPHGYGLLQRGGRGEGLIRAHRLSYELHIGAIPDGVLVLHRCDTPSCVNPDHLFLGNHRDNSRDMSDKRRWRNQSTRTEDEIREIRARREAGESLKSIAASFDMTVSGVCNIATGRNWKHVA